MCTGNSSYQQKVLDLNHITHLFQSRSHIQLQLQYYTQLLIINVSAKILCTTKFIFYTKLLAT